jgi:hypothetical protein
LRFGEEMRLLGLETNKAGRVGFMFKAPSVCNYWRSQKNSSTAANDRGRLDLDKAKVDVASMNRNNRVQAQ